jgi:hypothetical protein
LESFELDDTHSLVGDTAVARVMENILLEFDPELPLELNLLPPGIASDVIADLNVFDILMTPLDFRALLCVVPTHRRIDFRAWPRAIDMFRILTTALPIGSNECNAEMLADILHCIESPNDPLLSPFPLPDVGPLFVYQAPDEVEAEVDSIVKNLVAMILAEDIVRFVPVLTDIHDTEWESVLDSLISAPVLVSDAFDYARNTFSVERIMHITGPVPDRPTLITADDLVGRLLWQTLLPEVPVRLRELEEFISDELDEFAIGSPSFDEEEEDLPEEIVRMIVYKPKRAIRPED